MPEPIRILGNLLLDRAGKLSRGLDEAGRPLFVRFFDRKVHDIQGFSHRLVLRLRRLKGIGNGCIPALRTAQLESATPTVVFEGSDGSSLAERVKTRGPLRPAWAAAILSEVLGATLALAEAKVLPAVLSADTIWITTEGKVLLLALETPPELLTRDGPAPDLPALLLSIGAVVYEAASGQRAYKDRTVLSQTLTPPPPLGSIVEGVPPELSELLAILLSPRREDRLIDFQAARQGLSAIAPPSGTTSARLPALVPAEPPRRRRRLALGLAALLVVLGALAFVPWSGQGSSIFTEFVSSGGSPAETGSTSAGVSELSVRLGKIREGGAAAFGEEEAFLRDVIGSAPSDDVRRWAERELSALARRRNEHGEAIAALRTMAVSRLLLERRFRDAQREASSEIPPGLPDPALQRLAELAERVSVDAKIAYQQLEWQVQDDVATGKFAKAIEVLSTERDRYLEPQAEAMDRWRASIERSLPGPQNRLTGGGFDLPGHSGRPAGWTVEPLGGSPAVSEMALVDRPDGKALRISGSAGVRLVQEVEWPPDLRCALLTIEVYRGTDAGRFAVTLSGGGMAARLDPETGPASLVLDARSSSQAVDRIRVVLEAVPTLEGSLDLDRAVLRPLVVAAGLPGPEGPWDFAAGDPRGFNPAEGASRFQAGEGALEVRSVPDRPARFPGPPCRLPAHLYPAFRLAADGEVDPSAWTLVLSTAAGPLEAAGTPGGLDVVFQLGDKAAEGTEITGLELRLAAGRSARLLRLAGERNAEWDRLGEVLGSLDESAKTDPVAALRQSETVRFETPALARRVEEWRTGTRRRLLDGVRQGVREVLASRDYDDLGARLAPIQPLADLGDQEAAAMVALEDLLDPVEDFWRGVPRVLAAKRGQEISLALTNGETVTGKLEALQHEEVAIRSASGIQRVRCRDLAGKDLLRLALEAGGDRRFADLLVLAAFAVAEGDEAAAEECLARLEKAARTESERTRARTLRQGLSALEGGSD